MPRSRKFEVISNAFLIKSLDRLVADILKSDNSFGPTMTRVYELAKHYNVNEHYLKGYMWARLVMLARW